MEFFDDVKDDPDDLQNLLDLAELYPNSEEEEESIESENDFDDKSLFETDYEAVAEGYQLSIPSGDSFLHSLRAEYGDSLFYNTAEENEVIMQCTDSELQGILIKNRIRAKQLRALRNNLVKVLQEFFNRGDCTVQLRNPKRFYHMPKLDTWKLGKPYFKDNKFYQCPENPDVVKKRNNQEFCVYDLDTGHRWTAKQQVLLQCTVEMNYYKNKLRDLQLRIKFLKDNASSAGELIQLEEELEKMKTDPSMYKTPPLHSDEGVDWSSITEAFEGYRTVHECRAMWNVYVHPSINKQHWTYAENDKLMALAKKHRMQDWDLIASELGTNRSGYLVFLNYFYNLGNELKNVRFDPSEDERLLRLIDRYSFDDHIPWYKVALCFKNRTKQQLYHRYKYYLSHDNRIKGNFTEAEDILILYSMEKFGKDYTKCAQYVTTRTNIQIRNRYEVYLRNLSIYCGRYSESEDRMILDFVKEHGTKSWAALGRKLNRGRSHVRQRYLTLCKWLSNPCITIQNLPRRKLGTMTLQSTERYYRLQEIVDKLIEYPGEVNLNVVKQFIRQNNDQQEQSAKRRPWRVAKNVSHIDNQLVRFFKTTCKIQREYKTYDAQNVRESAARVEKLLNLFGASKNVIQNIQPEKEAIFTEREREVLTIMKNTPDTKPTFLTPQIRFLVPPTLNTLLGLRGLIVKYQMHKSESNTASSHDYGQTGDEPEKRLFLQRFCALFKWASIASKFFPDHLNKTSDEDTTPQVAPVKRPRGRPTKPENPKIALMMEGRKRMRTNREHDCANASAESTSQQGPGKEEAENSNSVACITRKDESESQAAIYQISTDTLKSLVRNSSIQVLSQTDLDIIQKAVPDKLNRVIQMWLVPSNAQNLNSQNTDGPSEFVT